MTREEFIQILKKKKYSYEIEGDKIVVTHDNDVNLGSLETIPSGVEFKNEGYVSLYSLQTLPPGVEFKNGGSVDLYSLKTIPPGVEFKNGGSVWLHLLKTIPPGVEFKNEGNVVLYLLIGGWFQDWSGNIEGVDSKRLLNLMISKGMFI